MNDRSQSNVASVLSVIVGAWLMLSPLWITMSGWALANILIVGGVIVVAGLVQLIWDNPLPSWVDAAAAAWLFVSAFLFDMSDTAMWNMAITAVIAFVVATWDGVEVRHIQHGHQTQT